MKKLTNRLASIALITVLAIALMTCLNSCKRDHLTLTTTSDVNIYSYLGQNSQYSMFKQIVDKAGYAGFLDTYGTYTIFAPNNDGVTAYLKAAGKNSIDNIDAATAKGLVSIALINDTIATQVFTDGKMRSPSTNGQYLITGAKNVNGVTTTVINKQANLVIGNTRVGNGIIHTIDFVLTPATLTLAQTIEQNSKYSIFTAALKATGFYDTINVAASAATNVNRKYLTVIAQTDSTFKAAGFADYNALKARYSTKGDPHNHADSLWLFVAYRVWPELSYLSDIASTDTHNTLAPLEITTSDLAGQAVLLNNDTFNGVLEPGQVLYRPSSDISATNGVLHNILTNYSIKVRLPSPVYFDVANQPEIVRTPGLYRQPGKSLIGFLQGSLANVTIVPGSTTSTAKDYSVMYSTTTAVPSASQWYYNNDFLTVGTRFRIGNNGLNVQAITFKTPVIVKGRYKIWVDYVRQGTGQVIPVTFDGQGLPNTFNPNDGLNEAEAERAAEVRGFKTYSDSPVVPTTNVSAGYNGFVGRLLGVVDIATTDRHSITFTATAATGAGATLVLDVIEFRPVDMDQLHPKLGRAGVLVP
jgi:uncharacterized surface protein with fasciclin (FAS1) repeats